MPHIQRSAPASHPYVDTIDIEPADYCRFCRMLEDAPQHKILDCDQSHPDLWPTRVASASKEAASRLRDAW